MERLGVVAIAYQLVGYLLCLYLRAAEYNGIDAWVIVHDALQGKILVLGVDHIVCVVDILGALIARADNNLLMVVQVLACYALHLL